MRSPGDPMLRSRNRGQGQKPGGDSRELRGGWTDRPESQSHCHALGLQRMGQRDKSGWFLALHGASPGTEGWQDTMLLDYSREKLL